MVHNQKLIVCVKHNGKILRENNDEVYLPFGSEYSILLKNLHTRKALADVYVDGEEVISQLILHPGENVELERFFEESMSKGHKLKFIQKTKDIEQFRGNYVEDGLVKVVYRFEKEQKTGIDHLEEILRNHPDRQPWERWSDPADPRPYKVDPYFWKVKFGDGTGQDTDFGNYTIQDSDPGNYTIWSSQNTFFGSTEVNYMSCSNESTNRSFNSQVNEQGITTQGEYSGQSFTYGNIGVLEREEYSIVLQLKGYYPSEREVKEPLTTREKIQCPMCGKKWRSSNRFCGNCGTYLL